MSGQSYVEYQEDMRKRLLPEQPANLDERETALWNRCVDLIRDHLGRDEARWPERYQECGATFGLLAKALNVFTPSAPEWQPIETAPKDGTRILLWCVHQNAQYAKDARAEGWEAAVIGEWTTHNGGGWVWHGLAGKHTHWMPLPAPPKAIDEKKL